MSFLFFYLLLTELYLGSLAALSFRALIRPNWIEPLTPAFLSLQQLRWVLPLAFLGLAAITPSLYPWAANGVPEGGFRALYLSRSGFLIRGIAYWALWITIGHFAIRKKAWTGGPGIVLLLFSASLAAVDWIESLDATLASTIFGLIFLLASFLAAFGFAYFFSGYRAKPAVRQDQGTIHFALVCVWTYLSAMQLIVIYAANKPDESHWYILRCHHGWQWIAIALGVFQFFVPFLALLQSPLKRSVPVSKTLAMASLVLQSCFLYWQIAPSFHPSLGFDGPALAAWIAYAAVLYFLGRRADAERI